MNIIFDGFAYGESVEYYTVNSCKKGRKSRFFVARFFGTFKGRRNTFKHAFDAQNDVLQSDKNFRNFRNFFFSVSNFS